MPSPSIPPSLLICASHRTGSNLLEQNLKAMGLPAKPREFFSPAVSQRMVERHGLPAPEADFLKYLAAVRARWGGGEGNLAVKVMWPHLAVLQSWLKAHPERSRLGRDGWETLVNLLENPGIIHLSRRDKLRQAISMLRAKQTGIYTTVHVDKAQRDPKGTERYDFAKLKHYVGKFTEEDAAWRSCLAKYKAATGCQVVEVLFEDLIEDPEGITRAAAIAAGQSVLENRKTTGTPMRSQRDACTEAWVEAYAEDSARRAPSQFRSLLSQLRKFSWKAG